LALSDLHEDWIQEQKKLIKDLRKLTIRLFIRSMEAGKDNKALDLFWEKGHFPLTPERLRAFVDSYKEASLSDGTAEELFEVLFGHPLTYNKASIEIKEMVH